MKIVRSKEFRAPRPWGALDIANMRGITTRLHWTDEPYHWHVNDGEEVFAVLDGRVEMRFKENGRERSVVLETGDFLRLGGHGARCSSYRRSTRSRCRSGGQCLTSASSRQPLARLRLIPPVSLMDEKGSPL